MNNLTDRYEEIGALALTVMDTIAPFDIYIQRGKEKYSKIINRSEDLDLDRINSYRDKGVKNFFINYNDFSLYSSMVSELGDRIASSVANYPELVQVELIKELAKHTVNEIAGKCKISANTLKNSSIVVNECINNLTDNPNKAAALMALLVGQPYLMKHSISVSIFSVLLAKQVGINTKEALEDIGKGALLHDLGTAQLSFDPEDIVNLNREQRKELKRHPQLGKQLFDHIDNLRREVSLIILQHHEQPNGLGYPDGLKGSDIYFPAKIVGLVSSFIACISKRSFRDALEPKKAIQIIKDDKGKYDASLVTALEKLLFPDRFEDVKTANSIG